MNKKIICLLIISIIIIILSLILLNKREDGDKNMVVNKSIEENNTENNKEEIEDAPEEFNEELLKDFDLEIKGITNDITKKIGDTKKFCYDLKKYMHQNGLTDSNIIQMKNYKENNSDVKLKFEMQNSRHTKIIATINVENKTCEFMYY